jgi:hypothetical protein
MKTGWLRQLLSIVLVFSFSFTTIGADGPGAPRAVLHASGKVQVNGTGSRSITTLFPGDSIQTDDDSVANIISGGSSVLVMPNASVKFLGNAVEINQGGVVIATSAGMAAEADGLTITPAAQKQSQFEVADNEDSVVVAARQGNVAVSDGQQSSTVPQGQETTRQKKKKKGGAAPAATGTHEISKTAIIAGGALGALAAGILIAESNNKKKCVSSSNNKKCKCKTDSKGNQVCEEG